MWGKTDRSGKNSEPNHIYKTTQQIPSTSNFHSFPTEFRTRQPHFCLGLSYSIIEFIRFSCHKGNIKMLLLASIWILLLFLVRNWISERQCHSFYLLRTMRICHHQRICAHPTTGINSVTATSVNSWKAFFDRNKIGARKSEFVGGETIKTNRVLEEHEEIPSYGIHVDVRFELKISMLRLHKVWHTHTHTQISNCILTMGLIELNQYQNWNMCRNQKPQLKSQSMPMPASEWI